MLYSARSARLARMLVVFVIALCLAAGLSSISFAEEGGADPGLPSATSAEEGNANPNLSADIPATPAPGVPSVKVLKKGLPTMRLALGVRGGADGFQIWFKQKSGEWKAQAVQTRKCKITGLQVNCYYDMRARAFKVENGRRVYGKLSKRMRVFNGINPLKSSEIVKRYRRSFVHGDKPAGQQLYIMLHDTEMREDALGTVRAWLYGNNATVAAHFVVSRDGTVVQTAPMDKILHHAGWGGPGNYDKKFGVGNNDGQGSGDDLVGRVDVAGFTSYGMNSHSIGIEMCRFGKQGYTKRQLKAVDRLIATIDRHYGGYAGKIIDHKAWRPANPDTNKKFAKYLKAYKKYRRHAR